MGVLKSVSILLQEKVNETEKIILIFLT